MSALPKILFVTASPLSVGGVENHLLALASGLKESYQFLLIGNLKAPFVDQWNQLGLRNQPHAQAESFNLGAVWQIRKVIKHERPNVIHIHDLRAGLSARMANIGLGLPIVCSNHYPAYQYVEISPFRRALYREVERVLNWTLTDCALFLFNNTFHYAVRRRIAPRWRAKVIQTGIPVETYLAASQEEGSKRIKGEERIELLVVARLSYQKRVGLAIQTTARLVEQGFNVNLSIVGDGPDRGLLENTVNQLGIREHVDFLGFRKDIPVVMARADIFLLTSRFEGGPYVLMEAMAAGLACVSIDIGDAALMLGGGVGCVISDPDLEKFSEVVASLCGDPRARKRMGIRAQDRAVAEFSLTKMINEYDNFYQELITRRGKSNG